MTIYTFRPFESSEQEYEALSSLLHISSPDGRPGSGEDLRREDSDWPEDSLLIRIAAYRRNEEMVAVGTGYQAYWQDSPSTVHLRFDIHPDCQQEQILPLLFEGLQGQLAHNTCAVERLASRTREDDSCRVGFLLRNGFREEMRSPSSVLQVGEFDASVCDGTYERLASRSIRLISLAQLCKEEPDWKRKLRDLRWEIVQDVPSTEPFAKPTVAEFEEMVLKDPALDEEAFFIAQADDGSLIGMSNLWRNDPEGKRLDTGLTGVVRSYRRGGIAKALKFRTIQYAQASGAETIETRNEEDSPMIALNRKLGFEPRPAWVDYVRETNT